jgi:hypothetical protein
MVPVAKPVNELDTLTRSRRGKQGHLSSIIIDTLIPNQWLNKAINRTMAFIYKVFCILALLHSITLSLYCHCGLPGWGSGEAQWAVILPERPCPLSEASLSLPEASSGAALEAPELASEVLWDSGNANQHRFTGSASQLLKELVKTQAECAGNLFERPDANFLMPVLQL